MIRSSLVTSILTLAASTALAQTTFTFETPGQLTGSALVSGDENNFIQTTEQAQGGTQSIRFDYTTPDAYQNWTYDIPFALQDGTISVWFYDSLGGNTDFNKFGGSIILEDKDDPSEFLAVEIWNGPYPGTDFNGGAKNYYLTRGFSAAASTFRSNYFGDRSIGWHEVVFTISPTQSTASVDGVSNMNGTSATFGPGSNDNLRLRFMAWSASDGGFSNWSRDSSPTTGFTNTSAYVTYDDLTITATTPAAATRTEGFEIETGVATYDSPTIFMGPTGFNNPFMTALVPQWNPATAAPFVRTGAQAIAYTNEDPVLKSLKFDLTSATPGEITFSFYDLLGPNVDFDKVGGAIMIQDISDPTRWVAAEIWNATYPSAEPVKNYYATRATGGATTTFRSAYYGDRAVGWQDVRIVLTATESRILINNQENVSGAGLLTGPGLNDGIQLVLMADSPSCGGFTNYAHPSNSELNYLYLTKTAPYLYFDNFSLPVAPASVSDWSAF